LAKVIAGIETVDHPSDPQLVSYAKTYMTAAEDTDQHRKQKVR
jgi:hypothetical protein